MKENLDELMNSLADMRGVIATTEEGLKGLKQRKNELEAKLIAKMEDQGIDRTGNDRCSVSIKVETVPTVTCRQFINEIIFVFLFSLIP